MTNVTKSRQCGWLYTLGGGRCGDALSGQGRPRADDLTGRGRVNPAGTRRCRADNPVKTSTRGHHGRDYLAGQGRVLLNERVGGSSKCFELGHGDFSFPWRRGNQLMQPALHVRSGNVLKSMEASKGPTTF